MRALHAKVLLFATLILTSMLGPGAASSHPLNARTHVAAGSPVVVGAVRVKQGFCYTGLFEFYAHAAGAVVAQRGSAGSEPPAATAEPWVAAMFYPYYGQNNVTVFTARPAEMVALHGSSGGVVRFSMPGVGSVRLEIKGSTATPRPMQVGLTTPESHHGHTWDIFGAFAEGKVATVTGSIKKGSQTYQIEPLRIDGALVAWIGEAGVVQIEST